MAFTWPNFSKLTKGQRCYVRVCWNGFHEKWERTKQRNKINFFPLSNISMRLRSRLRPLCTVVRHRSLCDNNILRQPTAVAVVVLYTSCRCWRHCTVHETHVLDTIPTAANVPECKIPGTQKSHDAAIGRHLTSCPVTWLNGDTTGRSTSARHMVKSGVGWRFSTGRVVAFFF